MTTQQTPTPVPVDASNADALRGWDGPDGDFWAEQETLFDAAVAGYRDAFLAAAAIAPGDRVLDIGCGTGQSTRDAARLAQPGPVLGVDLSSRMLALARVRAADEGLANTDFLQADAQAHRFTPAGYDVAISRTGAMFFGDPLTAFANIAAALRPGGRLALLVWQSWTANEWITRFSHALAAGRDLPAPPPDAPGPFALGDPERVHRILTAAGFADVTCAGAYEPMFFGNDVDDAYRLVRGLGFAKAMLADLDPDTHASAIGALRDDLTAHHGDDGVRYASAAWLVTATRPTEG